METPSRSTWARFASTRFAPVRFDWEGITIAAFLAGYVVLGGVVFAKVASFGVLFVN